MKGDATLWYAIEIIREREKFEWYVYGLKQDVRVHIFLWKKSTLEEAEEIALTVEATQQWSSLFTEDQPTSPMTMRLKSLLDAASQRTTSVNISFTSPTITQKRPDGSPAGERLQQTPTRKGQICYCNNYRKIANAPLPTSLGGMLCMASTPPHKSCGGKQINLRRHGD